MDGIQAWIALPKQHEETDRAFAHHAAAELPTFKGVADFVADSVSREFL